MLHLDAAIIALYKEDIATMLKRNHKMSTSPLPIVLSEVFKHTGKRKQKPPSRAGSMTDSSRKNKATDVNTVPGEHYGQHETAREIHTNTEDIHGPPLYLIGSKEPMSRGEKIMKFLCCGCNR